MMNKHEKKKSASCDGIRTQQIRIVARDHTGSPADRCPCKNLQPSHYSSPPPPPAWKSASARYYTSTNKLHSWQSKLPHTHIRKRSQCLVVAVQHHLIVDFTALSQVLVPSEKPLHDPVTQSTMADGLPIRYSISRVELSVPPSKVYYWQATTCCCSLASSFAT